MATGSGVTNSTILAGSQATFDIALKDRFNNAVSAAATTAIAMIMSLETPAYNYNPGPPARPHSRPLARPCNTRPVSDAGVCVRAQARLLT